MAGESSGSVAAYHAPRKDKKYFTLAEANRALPYVSRIVDDVVACYRHAVELRRQMEMTSSKSSIDELNGQYEQSMQKLNALVDELHQVGVELKDFDRGLIDFPAIHQGREVCLCWHTGEPTVGAWHETDAGFAGRQDVSVLDSPAQD